MSLVLNLYSVGQEKSFHQYIEPVTLGLRIYRGLILNLIGAKVPFLLAIN